MSDYYRYRIKKVVNFPSNVMVVRRGCSGTDIPVVYLHSLSKQVHSVHVSIVTYFRPGAQNCNLYDYYMINILNVIVVRCSFERSISKVDVFLFASLTVIQTVCITNSLSLLCYRYFVFKFIEKTVFHELQLLFRPSWPCSTG